MKIFKCTSKNYNTISTSTFILIIIPYSHVQTWKQHTLIWNHAKLSSSQYFQGEYHVLWMFFLIMITGDMERLRTKYYNAQNQKQILCKFLHLILLLIANALLYLQKLGLFARILCLWWIKGQNLLKEKWFAKLSPIDSMEIHFLYFCFL